MKREKFIKEVLKREGKDGSALFKRYNCATHWCMMQVYDFMTRIAGIKDFPYTFSCSGFKATDFAKPRINHSFETAEVGDIILFETNGNRADGPDHVGVVLGNDNGKIRLFEGNTCGRSELYFDTSTAGIFEYSDYAAFDCIIDMSDHFADDDVKATPEQKAEERNEDAFSVEFCVLKKGSKGKDVKAMQSLLIANGFSCGAWKNDGDFGTATEKAVKEYQKAFRLTVDGIAGKQTMTSLCGR